MDGEISEGREEWMQEGGIEDIKREGWVDRGGREGRSDQWIEGG
jgi:hypothetical protein